MSKFRPASDPSGTAPLSVGGTCSGPGSVPSAIGHSLMSFSSLRRVLQIKLHMPEPDKENGRIIFQTLLDFVICTRNMFADSFPKFFFGSGMCDLSCRHEEMRNKIRSYTFQTLLRSYTQDGFGEYFVISFSIWSCLTVDCNIINGVVTPSEPPWLFKVVSNASVSFAGCPDSVFVPSVRTKEDCG